MHAYKHESFLQIDRTIFDVDVQANSKLVVSLQYLKNEVRDEVDFLRADKHQSFLQVDFSIFGIKVYYKVILSLLMDITRYSQSTHSKKFAISLQ